MANKRLVLTPGYLVRNNEVVECHFARVCHKEEYYEKSQDYLVLVEGVYSFRKTINEEVFGLKKEAEAQATKNHLKDVKFCETQIVYYQDKLSK